MLEASEECDEGIVGGNKMMSESEIEKLEVELYNAYHQDRHKSWLRLARHVAEMIETRENIVRESLAGVKK